MRLYYDDARLREFDATVTGVEGGRVYLDRSAFYPASGGQPADTGLLGGGRVVDVVDEGERVAHVVEGGSFAVGVTVAGSIAWGRRFDHMQQHTGQHLLSAVLERDFGIRTVSFHMGAAVSTIDVDAASVPAETLVAAERIANEVVCEDRPVTVSYHDAGEDIGLRKASDRSGTLRVVTIADLDRSACGGTHVARTGEIGCVLLRGVDKVRNTARIEFVCGGRATARARADFDALSLIARSLSAPIDGVAALVGAQRERLADAEKERAKLAVELAARRGRELHAAAAVNASGRRVHVRRGGPVDDVVKAEARGFVGGGAAMYVAASEPDGAVFVAVSEGGPFRAGDVLRPLLGQHGGRGGGNASMAQGSVPSSEALEAVIKALTDMV